MSQRKREAEEKRDREKVRQRKRETEKKRDRLLKESITEREREGEMLSEREV